MTIEHSRNGELCPACGEGHLSSNVEYESVDYNGRQKDLPLYFSVCDHCGSELTGAAESKLNARAMTAFKKEVDGLLSGVDIKRFREKYNLKQDVCASIFGGGAVAFSRYENDDIMQSQQMDKLIRLCSADPQNITRLATQSGVLLQSETEKRIREESQRSIFEMIESALSAFGKSSLPEESTVPANDAYYERFGSEKAPVRKSRLWAHDLCGAAA